MWLWVVRGSAPVALLWALSWAQQVHACKCAEPPSAADAQAGAAAVFEGRVTSVTPLGEHDVAVELSVVRTWKNADVEKILVRTRADSAACGFEFQRDQSYLVYAQSAPADALPGLEVSHCGRTRPIVEADADIAAIGMGSVPVATTGSDAVVDAEDQPNHSGTTHNAVLTQHERPAAGGCASCSLAPHRTSVPHLPGALVVLVLGLQRLSRGRSRSRS
jgi:hypothetical protein